MEFDSQKKIIKYDNPIDSIEDFIYKYDVDFLRDSPNDLTLNFKGLWKNYNISISWDEFNKIINISSYFEIKKKKKISDEIYSLISIINEKVNLGYFNFCSKLQTVFFNYKVSVKGVDFLTREQVENFIDVVADECDKYFPVFYVFFHKKQNSSFALDAAIVETYGEA
jgi:hypothetical protein